MKHALIEKSQPQQIAIAEEAADWLVDAIACATQDRRYLRGEPECDEVAVEAIRLNGVIACLRAVHHNDLFATNAQASANEKVKALVEILEWQLKIIESNVTPNKDDVHRLQTADGKWHSGPVTDWVHATFTNWAKVNSAALAAMKETGA
jgi:hypothetical protein